MAFFMRIIVISIFLVCCLPLVNFSQNRKYKESIKIERSIKNFIRKHSLIDPNPKKKTIAAALDISMGFLGVHRLYLGTSPKVPVVYALTLGGGGFLILSDLVIMLSAKDLDRYSNNDHVLLWNLEN